MGSLYEKEINEMLGKIPPLHERLARRGELLPWGDVIAEEAFMDLRDELSDEQTEHDATQDTEEEQ